MGNSPKYRGCMGPMGPQGLPPAPRIPFPFEVRRDRLAPPAMVVLVCGPDEHRDRARVWHVLGQIPPLGRPVTIVMRSGASPAGGLGDLARAWALEHGAVDEPYRDKRGAALLHRQLAERGAHVAIAFPGAPPDLLEQLAVWKVPTWPLEGDSPAPPAPPPPDDADVVVARICAGISRDGSYLLRAAAAGPLLGADSRLQLPGSLRVTHYRPGVDGAPVAWEIRRG